MNSYIDELNSVYDKKLKAEQDALAAKKNEDTLALQRAAEAMTQDLRSQANSLAAERSRAERSFAERAAASGLSSGAAEQLRLAMDAQRRKGMDGIAAQRARADAENTQKLADLETRYRTDISSAIARNDFDRAQALMKEYKERDKQRESEAKLLASFGDFSGYEDIYGKDIAQSMLRLWKAKNRTLASRLGIY